ncbi:hypothetical protein SARC_03230 [Sphaeroforma arctica JP610]|uniref:RNI-like protein n=1 Tax=Sphaeroforma arctica JP610 TaxID=667725 RepID=A0A0L0G6B8_9EUKA|nr:hypothetical protein SARC_03230 [Sphaeroforma arctica JP610]KNC84557.1 hypothetical protein SARC_03230 [Sphaeroforma arctica JP610]|eukprot:XP_014158459.1 hypothetical protein SARC_03230 [Sphaeroforma arctica JP610]
MPPFMKENEEPQLPREPGMPTPVAVPTPTVWGSARANSPVDGWIQKLEKDDPAFKSLYVMSFRTIESADFIRLCAAIGKSKFLEEFHTGRELVENDLDALSQCLSVNSSLKILSVGNKNFGADGMERIFPGLAKNTSLRILDLENKGLGDRGMEHLARLFESTADIQIESMKLGCNGFTDIGASALLKALSSNTSITSIDMHGNAFGSADTGAALGAWLAFKECALQSLNLSTTEGLSEDFVVKVAQEGLARNTSLTRLNLNECAVGDAGVTALAEALADNKSVSSLFLDGCSITAVGASQLQALLTANTQIKELIIRNNAIHEEGFNAICSALRTNTTLDVLECGGCGVSRVAQIGSETSITHLGLFNNGLGDAGIASILYAVEANNKTSLNSLVSLDVSGNEISDDGFRSFCERIGADLELLPALTTLEIGGNKADDKEAWVSVCEALEKTRPGIRVIWGDGHKY